MPAMVRLRVLPAEIEIEAHVGQTVMQAAAASGLYWPTTCGGQGLCTTCLLEVIDGEECLVEMSRGEVKTLTAERGAAILLQPVRLACQAVVRAGPLVVVSKAGVRAADADP